MKILVTGSSGMLGTDLCETLKSEHMLIGLDVIPPRSESEGPQVFYLGSIEDPMKIDGIVADEKPDIAIHTAAWTDVDGCEKDPEKAFSVNTAGTRNVAAALSDRDVPMVFISTDFVFDGDKGEPYAEDDKANPISVYGRSKWEAEEAVRRSLSRYAIVRTSWLFGANGRNFVDTIIAKAKSGGHLKVVNDQVGSPTYTKDLAAALEALLALGPDTGRETYHVSNSGWCSWYDFARAIVEETPGASGVKVEPVTSRELARPAKRPRYSVMDTSKFEARTGYSMRPWREALKEFIKSRSKKGEA